MSPPATATRPSTWRESGCDVAASSMYERVGGREWFVALVDRFYDRVAEDPVLRPMYPEDLGPAREHLSLFLVQYWGGPADYNAERGHPRLRMRHQPFAIGDAERLAWFRLMSAAVKEGGLSRGRRRGDDRLLRVHDRLAHEHGALRRRRSHRASVSAQLSRAAYPIWSTAAPDTRSFFRSLNALSASSNLYGCAVTRTGMRAAASRNASPSERVLAVTLRSLRSSNRWSSYLSTGMSLR